MKVIDLTRKNRFQKDNIIINLNETIRMEGLVIERITIIDLTNQTNIEVEIDLIKSIIKIKTTMIKIAIKIDNNIIRVRGGMIMQIQLVINKVSNMIKNPLIKEMINKIDQMKKKHFNNSLNMFLRLIIVKLSTTKIMRSEYISQNIMKK